MTAARIPRTPARARIKAKDEAEFERWRKLAEKQRRKDASKRESVECVPNSDRSEAHPTGSPSK